MRFPVVYEQCKNDPKHVVQDRTRVDWRLGMKDTEGREIPDPCRETKMSDGLCSYAEEVGGPFGSSKKNSTDQCPECAH